jgi:hypothetical protein
MVPGTSNIVRAQNRCDHRVCTYHNDCKSNYCKRKDRDILVEVEGSCFPIKQEDNFCNWTVANIDSNKMKSQTLNRCEFVLCNYDSECLPGH